MLPSNPSTSIRIELECADAVCIGISVLTGPMIRGAIEAARHRQDGTLLRPCRLWRLAPHPMPGVHSAGALRRHVVVRGQGELTIVELATALAARKPLDFITGISWKRNGRLIDNLDRRVQPVDTPLLRPPSTSPTSTPMSASPASANSPMPPASAALCLQLLHGHGRLQAPLQRLCGGACRRRTDRPGEAIPHHQRRLAGLQLSRRPAPRHRHRAGHRGLRRVKFTWTFQASTDFICRMTQEEVQLLADSGVRTWASARSPPPRPCSS